MPRPEKVQCKDCGMWVEQQPVGVFRRFCDDCNRLKSSRRRDAWKKANPERAREHNRKSAARRRRNGRIT
jgi:hypothetical protein